MNVTKSIWTLVVLVGGGIGAIYFAFGVPYVPGDCSKTSGNRSCEVFNWVFDLGGAPAVAAVYLSFGLFCLFIGYVILKGKSLYA